MDARPADSLVIRSLEFLGGLAAAGGWRPESNMPEIAFSGRSNVGKSSLLNALVRRKAFARVSRTPGRTREINFFRVNDAFVMADLPGYGYARISKEKRQEWEPLIESYLRATPQLRGIVQILDSRRDISDHDRTMVEFLAEIELPTIFVATKIDKFSKAAGKARLEALAPQLGIPREDLIAFSAVTGEGRDDIAAAVSGLMSAPAPGGGHEA